MFLELLLSALFGTLAFAAGVRLGRVLLRRGATANNLFKGKTSVSLLALGLYMGLLLLALYVPQIQILPLEWRVSGMQITWTLMRVILMGFCGIGFIVSWHTARLQVIAVLLLGLVGIGSFTTAEAHFLAPIYASLENNLRPNGVFQQTSSSSCAPSALATVLRLWNIEATESSVARLAKTSLLGTSMPQLIIAAHGFGMNGIELSPTWTQMQQINRPGVLATWLYSDTGRAPHAIALLGIDSTSIIIADPAFGEIFQVNKSDFLKRYWRSQYVPIFRPSDDRLTPAKAADYLHRLGYLPTSTATSAALKKALRAFQQAVGVPETSKLDSKTALLLSGLFLENAPRLDRLISHYAAAETIGVAKAIGISKKRDGEGTASAPLIK
ncbi:peptidoglycan-binding protein [Phormidium tenue FACHB-886]|nr:peptidoglycan-binding protein [Phormidium tenue FACHB-886]